MNPHTFDHNSNMGSTEQIHIYKHNFRFMLTFQTQKDNSYFELEFKMVDSLSIIFNNILLGGFLSESKVINTKA